MFVKMRKKYLCINKPSFGHKINIEDQTSAVKSID